MKNSLNICTKCPGLYTIMRAPTIPELISWLCTPVHIMRGSPIISAAAHYLWLKASRSCKFFGFQHELHVWGSPGWLSNFRNRDKLWFLVCAGCTQWYVTGINIEGGPHTFLFSLLHRVHLDIHTRPSAKIRVWLIFKVNSTFCFVCVCVCVWSPINIYRIWKCGCFYYKQTEAPGSCHSPVI